MIHIISGPSCAGKSTLLDNAKIYSITNVSSKQAVVFPYEIDSNNRNIQDGCFIHYNLLRTANRVRANIEFNNKARLMYDFMLDPAWVTITKAPQTKKAIILIASRSVLEQRMSSRRHGEFINLQGSSPAPYPSDDWRKLLNTVDLEKLYFCWIEELKQQKIEFTLVNSENSNYGVMSEDELKHLKLNL